MKSIAFEMSMVKFINVALGKATNSVIRFAEILAPKIGICYLLRKSEFVPDGKKNHGLVWSKVNFFERTNSEYALANKTVSSDVFDFSNDF